MKLGPIILSVFAAFAAACNIFPTQEKVREELLKKIEPKTMPEVNRGDSASSEFSTRKSEHIPWQSTQLDLE